MTKLVDQNTVVLSHATELACQIVQSVAGEETSDRLNGERASQAAIKETISARLQGSLSKNFGSAKQ